MKKFNVLNWDFNHDKLEYYDVLPYFRNCYKERVNKFKQFSKTKKYQNMNEEEKKNYLKYSFVPKTLNEFKKFITDESHYQYWGRCEYEMICEGWPVQKNSYKLDIHEQIMMNIDIISDILFNENNKD